MKRKQSYMAPAILREVRLRPEGEILSGSVYDHVEVTSMGQEVHDYEAGTDFTHEWY